LDKWDTSGAVAMSSMFEGAAKFNQNINSWDVSHVFSFSLMFAYAAEFN